MFSVHICNFVINNESAFGSHQILLFNWETKLEIFSVYQRSIFENQDPQPEHPKFNFYDLRRYISLSVAKTIATSLITSRLDYCNSLLYNIASKDILKLQCVQNCLARVVTPSLRFSHSVPLLKSVRWLPVQSRIIFKICTIIYQTLSSEEPSYIFSMLSLAPKPRELRSSGFHLLSVPRDKTHAGIHAFSVAVPALWNSLLEHVKSSNSIISFRHHLKNTFSDLLIPYKFLFHPIIC